MNSGFYEVDSLGLAILMAPLYISIAWSLIITYQLFTETAVYSFTDYLSNALPSIGALLNTRIDTVVFIHAFAWIFVLASVVPSIILGKGRSILLQFFLCLTLTFVALEMEEILTVTIGGVFSFVRMNSVMWFQNPAISCLYLSAPYVFMAYLDVRARREKRKEEEKEAAEAVMLERITHSDSEGNHTPAEQTKPIPQ
jgi:hypothetical protein